jgi:hypothetical protein
MNAVPDAIKTGFLSATKYTRRKNGLDPARCRTYRISGNTFFYFASFVLQRKIEQE